MHGAETTRRQPAAGLTFDEFYLSAYRFYSCEVARSSMTRRDAPTTRIAGPD
jgi:hypothetical protein